ncbi:MAG: sigma-70 family RNA polymerase sigma factor [Burkholderiales bacterium]
MNTARQPSSPRLQAPRPRTGRLTLVPHPACPPAMLSSDALTELAGAVARQDREAFAVLFKHFAPRIKSYLIRSGCPPELSDDLAQETMVGVWHKADQFDPARAQLSTWVFTIARHLRIDRHRRDGGAEALHRTAVDWSEVDTLELSAAADDEPAAQLHTHQRERGVRQALAQLNEEQALIVRLSYFEEQPHAQIAQALGLPVGTVKSRIRLAMGHLRRLLNEFAP